MFNLSPIFPEAKSKQMSRFVQVKVIIESSPHIGLTPRGTSQDMQHYANTTYFIKTTKRFKTCHMLHCSIAIF